MNWIINLSRRDFLKAGTVVGGGLVLGFAVPISRNPGKALAADPAGPVALSAFIHVAPDDTVTMIVNKSEMGQGVYTALPMLVA